MDRRTPHAGPAAGAEGTVAGEKKSGATGTISSVDAAGQAVELTETDAGPMQTEDPIDVMDKPKPCVSCGISGVLHKPASSPIARTSGLGDAMRRAMGSAGKGKMTKPGTPIIASPAASFVAAPKTDGTPAVKPINPVFTGSISTRGLSKMAASNRINILNKTGRKLVY